MIKDDLIKNYVTWRNYFNKGRGETGWAKDTAKDFVYVLLAIYLMGNNIIITMILVSAYIAYLFFCVWLGWWWDKRKAFRIENDWSYKRSSLKHLMKK